MEIKKQKISYGEFTEDYYRYLIKLAKSSYRFISYKEYLSEDKVIIWRHDADSSIQRALSLAVMESEEDIHATYFIHLHSKFYNPFEMDNFNAIKKIISLGHDIGIHFDCEFYEDLNLDKNKIYKYLEEQKKIFETMFNVEPFAFSFHNPTEWIIRNFEDASYCGMINTYSSFFKNEYGYCSDSNGYWRFDRLEEILLSSKYEQLQVLTHPEWWQEELLSPRNRIQRCIDGRAKATAEYYDMKLLENKRVNK